MTKIFCSSGVGFTSILTSILSVPVPVPPAAVLYVEGTSTSTTSPSFPALKTPMLPILGRVATEGLNPPEVHDVTVGLITGYAACAGSVSSAVFPNP